MAAHYHGVQTVYELSALGTRLDAVELGTTPRYAVGEVVEVTLPPHLCMVYAQDAAVGPPRGRA